MMKITHCGAMQKNAWIHHAQARCSHLRLEMVVGSMDVTWTIPQVGKRQHGYEFSFHFAYLAARRSWLAGSNVGQVYTM